MLIAATIIAVCFGLPLAFLGAECWLALLPLRRNKLSGPAAATDPEFLVLVPAHDEEGSIGRTTEYIRRQVGSAIDIIVIADNCSDRTADRARAAGAIVWERSDDKHRGKGYTLNFAMDRLRGKLPEVIVFIDADCEPEPGCIQTIARLAHDSQRPVQSAYVMHAPPGSGALSATSALAVYVKNIVRPRGLQRLGLPCLLNGSGMAIPRRILEAVRFPDGHIAEDTRVSTDLAMAGFAPLPCMEATISTLLPELHSGFVSQRTRWEHGHLITILYSAPRLAWAFVKRPSLNLLALLFELSVPPLTLLVGFTAATILGLAAVSYGLESWTPLLAYLAMLAPAVTGLLTVWLVRGRRILSPRMALQIPRYAFVKAPFYLRFLTNRQRTWVRTARSSADSDRPKNTVL